MALLDVKNVRKVYTTRFGCLLYTSPGNELFDLLEENRRKKILPYPICSVVAVLKMLIRILDTLRSRIWDVVLFLFSVFWLRKEWKQ